MLFDITIDQENFQLDIPEKLLEELKPVCEDMDKEFEGGVQMGRYWVESPGDFERCQVAADRVASAMAREDKRMLYINAAYILYKAPTLNHVTVDTEYEMQDIDIVLNAPE